MRLQACGTQSTQQPSNYYTACNTLLCICYGKSSGILSQLSTELSGVLIYLDKHACRLQQGSCSTCTPVGGGWDQDCLTGAVHWEVASYLGLWTFLQPSPHNGALDNTHSQFEAKAQLKPLHNLYCIRESCASLVMQNDYHVSMCNIINGNELAAEYIQSHSIQTYAKGIRSTFNCGTINS